MSQPTLKELRHSSGATAQISPQGGQVLSWRCAGHERLYVSPRADLRPGKALRGGVPVIFPQFGIRGSGLRHGFARLEDWTEIASLEPSCARFALGESARTLATWPHRFRAELEITLGERQLSIGLHIHNTGTSEFSFTAALHTYLRVEAVSRIALHGLERCHFLDATCNDAPGVQADAALSFEGEVDRIYLNPPGDLLLEDGAQRLRIQSRGFTGAVIWNPGAEIAAGLPDLGTDQHVHFVCIEPAVVETPVYVPAGTTWVGRQILQVEERLKPYEAPIATAHGAPVR